MLTLYISGPMSGHPQYNVPLFDAVAAALRAQGYTIISPAELDSKAVREAALASPDGKPGPGGMVANETWGDMLSRDVKLLADGYEAPTEVSDTTDNIPVDGIVLLPGWENSRGARLEAVVGLLTGKAYYTLEAHRHGPTQDVDYIPTPVAVEWVQYMLAKQWKDAIALYEPI